MLDDVLTFFPMIYFFEVFLVLLSFIFILDTVGFQFSVFADRVNLHSWLETDLIYSAVVIHVGKDGTGKSAWPQQL